MMAHDGTRITEANDLDLAALLDQRPATALPAICWLGQAGFLLYWQGSLLLIDPYLSDSLAKKYQAAHFPHTRMMPAPIDPQRLERVDLVFCTHAHTDHMDGETLSTIAQRSGTCRFIVPHAARDTAVSRGVPPERLATIDAHQGMVAVPGVTVQAIPSAHEQLQVDQLGHHHFLGYVICLGELVLYHSGDCVPYPGLVESLAPRQVDVALLPVNGRDAARRAGGVPGNFTFAEAAGLCREAGIPALVACHFGMFDFNTVDPHWLDQQMAATGPTLRCVRPVPGRVYWLEKRFSSRQRSAAISQRKLS